MIVEWNTRPFDCRLYFLCFLPSGSGVKGIREFLQRVSLLGVQEVMLTHLVQRDGKR